MLSVFSVLGFGVWGVIAYEVYRQAIDLLRRGETTGVIGISPVPFLLVSALVLLMCSLMSLLHAFHAGDSESDTPEKKEEDK